MKTRSRNSTVFQEWFFVPICFCLLFGFDRPTFGQAIIGASHEIVGKETPHPYDAAPDLGTVAWSTTINHPGSNYIKVLFTDFSIGPDDYVIVRDPDSVRVYRYGSESPDRFWSVGIWNDGVIVELFSASATTAFGFKIGGYAESSVDPICDPNQLCGVDVECMPPVGTPAYALREPVCAIIYPDNPPGNLYVCSGYQIAHANQDIGYILTNRHCRPPGPAFWAAAEAWFNAERVACAAGGMKPITPYVLEEVCFSPPKPDLDYSLLVSNRIGVNDPHPIVWGKLPLRSTPPIIGEFLYHFQHSGGCQKHYVNGHITGHTPNQNPDYWQYTMNIRGGSSGSPVIAAADECVAVHHGYGFRAFGGPLCFPGGGSQMSSVLADMIAQSCLPSGVDICPGPGPNQEVCCFTFTPPPAGLAPCGLVPTGFCNLAGGALVPSCLGDSNGDGIDDACGTGGTPPDICCYPFAGGGCLPVPGGTCVQTGGTIVAACLGDATGNGIDDACDGVLPPDICCYPSPGVGCGVVAAGTCVPTGGIIVAGCLGDIDGNGIDDACDNIVGRPNPDPELGLGVVPTVHACSTAAECSTAGFGVVPNVDCIPAADGSFPGTCYVSASRYLSIAPNPLNMGSTARRIALDTNDNDTFDPGVDHVLGWVGMPFSTFVSGPEPSPQAQARVSATSVYRDWNDLTDVDMSLTGAQPVHVGDCEIAPKGAVPEVIGNVYFVQAINLGDDEADEGSYSAPLRLRTTVRHGDPVGNGNYPNGSANLGDAFAAVLGFQGLQVVPKRRLEMTGGQILPGANIPDYASINLIDVFDIVSAFQSGGVYPYHQPCDCPGQSCP